MEENIIYKDLENGYFQLKAKKGFILYSIRLNRAVSEAVVKEEEFKNFKAVI